MKNIQFMGALRWMLVVGIMSGVAPGQTQVDFRTQGKNINFSAAGATLPAQTGTQLPATCMAGEQFFKLDAPDSGNLYLCNPADKWSQVMGVPSVVGYPNHVLVSDGTTPKWEVAKPEKPVDFQASIAGNVLTIEAGRAASGNSLCERVKATAMITAGSGPAAGIKVYLDSECALHVDYPASAGLTVGCAQCVAGAVTTPSVPAGGLFLAQSGRPPGSAGEAEAV